MTLEQIARLYVIFKTLEPEIKEWIASDDTSAIIKAIAARFVLSDEQEQKLPILILRLVTQDLPPESFKAELAKEASVDTELAKNITEAITKEVVEPIAAALRYSGVNTGLLGFNAPPTSPSSAPQADPIPVKTESAPETQAPAPFILHEEPRMAANGMINGTRQATVSPRVVIERVVHYSQLRTPLNTAGGSRIPTAGGQAKPKLPQSKWFV